MSRVELGGLPTPVPVGTLRAHYFATYGRQRPGKTPVRIALSL
jgi:hypothetical protein